jgi:hypothetical protein
MKRRRPEIPSFAQHAGRLRAFFAGAMATPQRTPYSRGRLKSPRGDPRESVAHTGQSGASGWTWHHCQHPAKRMGPNLLQSVTRTPRWPRSLKAHWRSVHVAGATLHPDNSWMAQVARREGEIVGTPKSRPSLVLRSAACIKYYVNGSCSRRSQFSHSSPHGRAKGRPELSTLRANVRWNTCLG